MPDVLVSFAEGDAPLAEGIAALLARNGLAVAAARVASAGDGEDGRRGLDRLDRLLAAGARMIALLTPAYLASARCTEEWRRALDGDLLDERGRLIVLRAADVEAEGLLAAQRSLDLVAARSDPALIAEAIRAAVRPANVVPDEARVRRLARPGRQIAHPAILLEASGAVADGDLMSIDGVLWSEARGAALVGATGGTSALARAYARVARDGYAGVWWCNARGYGPSGGAGAVERELAALGRVLVPDAPVETTPARLAAAALAAIATEFHRPWLLVVENVGEAGALAELGEAGNLHLLVTSRDAARAPGLAPLFLAGDDAPPNLPALPPGRVPAPPSGGRPAPPPGPSGAATK